MMGLAMTGLGISLLFMPGWFEAGLSFMVCGLIICMLEALN